MSHAGWTLQVASDVQRDGLGLELMSRTGASVGEIFRGDAQHSIGVSLLATDVPPSVLEWFRAQARRALGDTYEDGTPIDWSRLP